jgi:hypothetical protein
MSPPDEEAAVGVQPQPIRLEPHESVVLSPESPRFAAGYRQVRPQSIDEVRKLMGANSVPEKARDGSGALYFRAPELAKQLLRPEDLEVRDPVARARARRLVYLAAQEYVQGTNTDELKQWCPVINRWLADVQPIISVFAAEDIEIADGATLTLSANTQVLKARHIRMHGSGRIRCLGNVKISATSVKGS